MGKKKKIHLSPKPWRNKLAVLTSPPTPQVVSVYFHLDVKLKTTEQIQLLCTSLEKVQNYPLFQKGQLKYNALTLADSQVECIGTIQVEVLFYYYLFNT